jgi:heme exporter protein A
MTAPTIQAAGLGKTFGRRAAVSGVDFELSAGDCLALFGPNGAGKTTLLRLLAGLLRPSAGTAKIHAIDVRRDHAARAAVGLISHQSMLYAALTARENVEFSARLYGLPDPSAASAVSLERMRVLDVADVPVRTLSRGLQQRVSIARGIVHQPRVLLLDEPYSGLDEAGANALTMLLTSLRSSERHATLVVVTHNVAEGLALATHAAIMRGGRFARFDRRDDRNTFDVPKYAAEYRELVSRAG